jgi:NitT/TauT family transport system permease protein
LGLQRIWKPDYNGHRWIIEDVIASGRRLALGLAVGLTLSITVGMALLLARSRNAWPNPYFFSKIAPTAMLAVYMVAFGTELKLSVAIIGLGIFPSMAMSIYSSIRSDVPMELIYKSFTVGASNMETVYEVVYKQILPRIIQNIQSQIGPAMVFLIATEWVMSDVGFGYRLRMQARLLNMNVVYSYLAILGLVGFLIDRGLISLRHRLCPWFGD